MAAVVALILGVCISRTRGEIGYWKNGSTLWSRAVAVTKNNFLAHYCLGLVLSHTYPDEALAEYQKSVDAYPDYADAQRELGLLLSNGSHFSNAIVHLERAIQLDPQNSWTYHGLGITLFEMGRAGDAVPPLLKAVEIDPQNTPYIDDLAQILFFSGHQTETVSSCLATARSDPAGFARLLDAVQFDTNHVDLINNLALCFATNPDPKLCNGKYAVRLATRACEMTGFRTNYFIATLAAAYAEDSRFDEAVSSAQLACSLASAAGQPELLKKYQAFVELFRSHQPYHVAIN
jgi:tetratricopeptide (TPR) repeat protein